VVEVLGSGDVVGSDEVVAVSVFDGEKPSL
jgi:hypothetical protein